MLILFALLSKTAIIVLVELTFAFYPRGRRFFDILHELRLAGYARYDDSLLSLTQPVVQADWK